MFQLLIIAFILLSLYITIVLVLLQGLKTTLEADSHVETANNKKITVIVALRNEAANIEGLVSSLKAQYYDNYEVILVDDASTDSTFKLIEHRISGLNNFRLIPTEPNRFGWGPKKNAIHSGIEISSGEIILTTDADCRPRPGWIDEMASRFSKGVAAVVGYSPLKSGDSIAGRLKALEAFATGLLSAAFIGLGRPFISVGRNFAYRRNVYLELGGFGRKGKAPAGDDDLLLQEIARRRPVVFAFGKAASVPSYPQAGEYISRKRRHFTVARHYPALFIGLGLMLFLFLLAMILTAITGIINWSPITLSAVTAIFTAKILIDYAFLKYGSKILPDKFRIIDLIMAEIIQFPYTLLLQPLSFVGRIKWKGRKL